MFLEGVIVETVICTHVCVSRYVIYVLICTCIYVCKYMIASYWLTGWLRNIGGKLGAETACYLKSGKFKGTFGKHGLKSVP